MQEPIVYPSGKTIALLKRYPYSTLRSNLMKNISIQYKTILFIIWSLVFAYVATTMHFKDVYVLSTLINFPTSIIISYIIDFFEGNLLLLLCYLSGLIQWTLIIGTTMDKFIPNVNFNIQVITLIKLNKYLFILGLLGLLLSAVVINNGYISEITYNIALALTVSSIGIKILFLDKDNKV